MRKLLVFILFFSFVTAGCHSFPEPPKTGFEGMPMPDVKLRKVDSMQYFNTRDIPKGQPTVLFYFSPYCPYCRAQLKEMTENMDELKDTKVYIMTYATYKDFKSLYDEFKINKYPNIIAGLDYTDSIRRYFKLKGVPFTAIYNPQKKLSKAFNERITIDQIEDAVRE